MTEIHGFCDDRFTPVRDAFRLNFEERDEVGASVAVSHEGEMVVDLWAGHRDEDASQAWEEDTIVNVYSTTKTMSFLVALLLADKGELDLAAPVVRYWPEFGQSGKRDIPFRYFMSHSAGLSGMDKPCKGEALYDWLYVTKALAAQEPWWEPGTASGYHALTQGYLIGEVVRRITGQTLGTFFRKEIAEPLGADFWIGVPESELDRIGELIPPKMTPLQAQSDADSIAARTFANPLVKARDSRTVAWQQAEIPAANGHGNARSVVRAQTVMANGGSAWGRKLMSEAGVRRALEEQTNGDDLVLDIPISFGMGYALNGDVIPISPNPNTCYWGGWGGSSIVVDMDARLCFSYVMNRMEAGVLGDRRGYDVGQAVYASLR